MCHRQLFKCLIIVASLVTAGCNPDLPDEKYTGTVMRDIGNQLLWSLGDSTTRILPVVKEGETWVIAFEQPVALARTGGD